MTHNLDVERVRLVTDLERPAGPSLARHAADLACRVVIATAVLWLAYILTEALLAGRLVQ